MNRIDVVLIQPVSKFLLSPDFLTNIFFGMTNIGICTYAGSYAYGVFK